MVCGNYVHVFIINEAERSVVMLGDGDEDEGCCVMW